MQRLLNFYTGTSRLVQVVGVHHWQNRNVFFKKFNGYSNITIFTFERYFATRNSNSKDVDTHPKLYKPSVVGEETHISNNFKGGESSNTININATSTLSGGGKVWSTQSVGDLHVASVNETDSAAFAPKVYTNKQADHETTVYSTKGKLNMSEPFKIHPLQPESTSGQLAEAAAASAFQSFGSNTSLNSKSNNERVFTPKISSTDGRSTTLSPTAQFDTIVSTTSTQEPMKYEMASKPKVFGGQDTTADARKHPKENPFNLKEKIQINQQAK